MQKPLLSEGYGIMPNLILFDAELSSTAKLMFCYISSLCASTGSCRPRNKHLAEKFSLKIRQVQSILEELRPYISAYNDEQGRRMLALTSELTDEEGGCRKLHGGVQKISPHSNSNSKEKEYTSEQETNIAKVYDYWIKLMVVDPAVRVHGTTDEKREALLQARKHVQLSASRKAKILARINSQGLDRVLKAVINISKSEFHRTGILSDGTQGDWTADLTWFTEKDERVEKWANKGGAE